MVTRKIFRVFLQDIFRKTYLLGTVEKMRYGLKLWLYRTKNKHFKAANPDFALPPEHLAFDAYSAPHWDFYKISGEVTAKFLAGITSKYFSSSHPLQSIFEWGCGPGRIIRQLRAPFGNKVEIYASDYNPETIEWCSKNIPGVSFVKNELQPPLPYPDNKFDFVYAISIVTHLTEENGLQWVKELYRTIKPGGVLLITTDGDNAYRTELLPDEKRKYDTAGIVVRGKYEEGKKMFLTRHSPRYVREKLLQDFEVLEHKTLSFPFMKQDYWVARKR
jgi:SAM-dependent methyltransferase